MTSPWIWPRQLEADVHDLINPDIDTSENSVLDDAVSLQTDFASKHPIAESLLRELIDTLGRMGI